MLFSLSYWQHVSPCSGYTEDPWKVCVAFSEERTDCGLENENKIDLTQQHMNQTQICLQSAYSGYLTVLILVL
jgi:hypothetical protein